MDLPMDMQPNNKEGANTTELNRVAEREEYEIYPDRDNEREGSGTLKKRCGGRGKILEQ